MKQSRSNRFRFLTPTLVAAILSVPLTGHVLAQPAPRVEEQQRQLQQRQREQVGQPVQAGVDQRANAGSVTELSPHLDVFDRASKLIGMNVRGTGDEALGEIEELAIDLESGRVIFAIIETGGLAGIGAKHVAVPTASLTQDLESKTLRMDATRESIKSARSVDLTQWDTSFDDGSVGEIYQSYGKTFDPAERRYSRTATVTPGEANIQSTDATPRDADPSLRLAREREQSPAADQQRVRAPMTLGPVERATKLLGAKAQYASGENVGKVEELIIDLRGGRLVNVVISSGGFLGIGDELSLVPPMAFNWDAEGEVLHLNATTEQLTRAHRVSGDAWPRQDRNTVAEGYRVFNYDSADHANVAKDTTAPVDNSARNRRDRSGGTLTPFDQGNNEADLGTTTRIRKELTSRDDLSVMARNVKIITVNNTVTLRGPVASEAEKQLVAKIAMEVAGNGKVDDQLEVKSK